MTRDDTCEYVIVVINDRKPFRRARLSTMVHGPADVLEVDEDGETAISVDGLA